MQALHSGSTMQPNAYFVQVVLLVMHRLGNQFSPCFAAHNTQDIQRVIAEAQLNSRCWTLAKEPQNEPVITT